MDTGNISKTVGPNLLWREGGDSVEYLVHSSKINDLVKVLIDEHHTVFPVGMTYFPNLIATRMQETRTQR